MHGLWSKHNKSSLQELRNPRQRNRDPVRPIVQFIAELIHSLLK